MGRLHTRYAPVRHSSATIASTVTVRLACIKPAASVHPEPGSNSPFYLMFLNFRSLVCPDFIACVLKKNLRVICYIIPFFQRTSRFPFNHCFSLKRAAKIHPFLIRSANFLSFFLLFLSSYWLSIRKNFIFFFISPNISPISRQTEGFRGHFRTKIGLFCSNIAILSANFTFRWFKINQKVLIFETKNRFF